jgi:hypothetical protein
MPVGDNWDFGDELDAQASGKAAMRQAAHIVNGGTRGGDGMVDCPKCRGSGDTRWGACFRCDGKGKVTVRSAAASKARVTAANNVAQWQADNADLIAWLHSVSEWNNFAKTLIGKIETFGTLREWDVEKAQTMRAKIAASREAKAEQRKAAAPEVDVSAIVALFDRATDNDVKKPVFRAAELTLSKAPAHGRNPGAIYVNATVAGKAVGGEYLGKIEGGRFIARREAPAETIDQLRMLAVDPDAEAIRYASRFSACGVCGTAVVDPVSVRSIIGPICARKWGLVHLREAAREDLEEERKQEQERMKA